MVGQERPQEAPEVIVQQKMYPYRVKKGDTFYGLARLMKARYNLPESVPEITQKNMAINDYTSETARYLGEGEFIFLLYPL